MSLRLKRFLLFHHFKKPWEESSCFQGVKFHLYFCTEIRIFYLPFDPMKIQFCHFPYSILRRYQVVKILQSHNASYQQKIVNLVPSVSKRSEF